MGEDLKTPAVRTRGWIRSQKPEFEAINIAGDRRAFLRAPNRVTAETFVSRVMRPSQRTPRILPPTARITPVQTFLEFLRIMGPKLLEAYHTDQVFHIYPKSCYKMAAAAAYVMRFGGREGTNAFRWPPHINAYLARTSCRSYAKTFRDYNHEFVVVNIEGAEYVVDFAADQFAKSGSPTRYDRISPVIMSLDEARRAA